jgi:hypothetical protein
VASSDSHGHPNSDDCLLVIAREAKQSRIFPRRPPGLLRRKGSSQ